MISETQFNDLLELKIGSWAIWSETGHNNLEFFKSRMSELHGNVLLLGLNRSGKRKTGIDTKYEFNNFHSPKHAGDSHLETYFCEGKLNKIKGGYMTDLYLDIEGNSGKITKKTDDQHKEAVRFLFDQIDILNRGNVNDKTILTIICFSDKCFDHLLKGGIPKENIQTIDFNIKYINAEFEHNNKIYSLKIYRVYHYSYRFKKSKEYIEVIIPAQLSHINELLQD